jgi:uncharacterized protein YodC (DUF2158 family)
MQDQIAAGDVVELESGGHHMTVESINVEDHDVPHAYCAWQTHPLANFKHDHFAVMALKLVKKKGM